MAARGPPARHQRPAWPGPLVRGRAGWAGILTVQAVTPQMSSLAAPVLLLLVAATGSSPARSGSPILTGRLSLQEIEPFLKPPPPPPAEDCDLEWRRALEATGQLSVLDFADKADKTDDAPAVRRAINASRACGGGVVAFPARKQGYSLESTVVVERAAGLQLRGSGGAVAEFTVPPQVSIRGPKLGPAFIFRSSEKFELRDISIKGGSIAVLMADCAVVRVSNCAMAATTVPAGTIDDVNTSLTGCNGCNVVLGSENAALIVENSFWLSFTDSSFVFVKHGAQATNGQRPSVILRGANHTASGGGGGKYNVNSVYIVRFEKIVFVGGGVQYQQLTAGWQWPGWFDFVWCVTENAATPLLDLQVSPAVTQPYSSGVEGFKGLQDITVQDFSAADNSAPSYYQPFLAGLPAGQRGGHDKLGRPHSGLVPIVAVNCTTAAAGNNQCGIDGLLLTAVAVNEGGSGNGPAVRVFTEGDAARARGVRGVTVLSSQLTGGNDVVDERDQPIGSWASRSAGGWTLVAAQPSPDAAAKAKERNESLTFAESRLTAQGAVDTGTHALLVGQSGEMGARLAIEGSGAMRWADGTHGWHTTASAQRSNVTTWDPPALAPGKLASTDVALAGSQPADIVTATHEMLGDHAVFVSGRVASAGRVRVFLHNDGEVAVDLASGLLRVATVQYL